MKRFLRSSPSLQRVLIIPYVSLMLVLAVGIDRFLMEVAGRFRNSIRPSDIAARYGGDEFVILLWQIENLAATATFISKLNQALSEPLHCLKGIDAGNHAKVGASIGVALYPGDGNTADSLIKNADNRMYEDKTIHRTSS